MHFKAFRTLTAQLHRLGNFGADCQFLRSRGRQALFMEQLLPVTSQESELQFGIWIFDMPDPK